MLTSTCLRVALRLSPVWRNAWQYQSVWRNAWQYQSPVRETWNKTQTFWTTQSGEGTWEMCRKHKHLPSTNRRVPKNVDKFCVIVADLSQNTEFLFCFCFVSVASRLAIVPGAYPASYTMGAGSFTGLKRHGRGVGPQNHLEPKLKKQ
jgi:hypothetical protein